MKATGCYVFAASLMVMTGCRSTPDPRPHDMSVAAHEVHAAHYEARAAAHERLFDPKAIVQEDRCRAAANTGVESCWTSMVNPTLEHLQHAAEHKRQASQHRAAARILRETEAKSCAGIPDDDRDESPFDPDRRDDVLRVDPLLGYPTWADGQRLEGATVTFRRVQGMTVDSLQRIVDCHLARNAALGYDVPEMHACPLTLKGVTARATAAPDGFAVTIRASDDMTAQEVFRRVLVLLRP